MIDKRTITRRLSQMTTLDVLRFKSLTVRLNVSESYTVWTVSSRDVVQTFQYNSLRRRATGLFTTVDMLAERRESLDAAVDYIVAHQDNNTRASTPYCRECHQLFVPSRQWQTYCSARCRNIYQCRQRRERKVSA